MAKKKAGNKASSGISGLDADYLAKFGVTPEQIAALNAELGELGETDEQGNIVALDAVSLGSLDPDNDDDSSQPSGDGDGDDEGEELSDIEAEAAAREAAYNRASSEEEARQQESVQNLNRAYSERSGTIDFSDEVDEQGRPIDVDAEWDAERREASGISEDSELERNIQKAVSRQPEEKKKKEARFSKGMPDYSGGRAWALNLVELHGDNPDDWMMIHDFSYNYVVNHFNGILRDRTQNERIRLAEKDDAVPFVGIAFARLVLKAPVFRTLQEAQNWIIQTAAGEWLADYRSQARAAVSLDQPAGESGGTVGDVIADEQSSFEHGFADAQDYIDSIRASGDNDHIALLDKALQMLEGQQLSPVLIRDTIEGLAKEETRLGD